MLTDELGESAWRRAAVISLLSWRRADAGDVLDDAQRYGWWGDSFPSLADDRIGSRLWQLRRRSLTAETERDAIAFAREALAWMLDDGRVSAVTVTAARGVNRLDLVVVLSMRDGTAIDVQLDNLWQVIHAV
ncbi:phage GP46 family protein [Pseudomonas sp. 148P]|uniref:Phage GP46 family protein n=1 Tax=Pseudomonas ulcerans TaxID=3115852 RepID=A0ABU7HW98_9PSED|nr:MULTISPECIES: phage GP46 family protein [unclassified Pseudomonas]MEE1922909.1 phage GP46 family protein [Pseudomonas sp. 147P]MEE1935759.1 phage GP46 family protein [Pseudomonas sp. 148P]